MDSGWRIKRGWRDNMLQRVRFATTSLLWCRWSYFISGSASTQLIWDCRVWWRLSVSKPEIAWGWSWNLLPVFLAAFWEFTERLDSIMAKPYTLRIFKTVTYMLYLIHLNACAYFAISAWEGIGKNDFVYNGEGNAYIRCFYFATKVSIHLDGLRGQSSEQLPIFSDGDLDWQEQETDQRTRNSLHDWVLAHGSLRVRHPDWRHQGYR